MSDNAPRRSISRACALIVSFLVMGGVLYLGFLRVIDNVVESESTSVGAEAPTNAQPAPTQPTTSPSTNSQGGAVTSATGSIPPAQDPPSSGATPSGTVGSSTPSTEPPVDPPKWPATLPDLGEHKMISHLTGPEERWVFEVPGGPQLAGGGFLADLEKNGWKVEAITTPNTVTATGELDRSRLSVTLRPGEASTAAGWSRLEIVYLERVPDFEVPTTTPPPTDEEAARKRS